MQKAHIATDNFMQKMRDMFTFGNAESDGSDFFGWFVGRIDNWCEDRNLSFDAAKFGLRNTGDLEIKWDTHLRFASAILPTTVVRGEGEWYTDSRGTQKATT